MGTLLGGLLAFILGPAIDRHGARQFLLAASLATGVLFVLLGKVHGLLLFFVLMISGRMLLQGVFNVAIAVVPPKWFVAQRGRATAIAALGSRLGTAAIPLGTQLIITGANWRAAAITLGIVLAAIAALPVFLWMKGRPEDMGLLPYGVTPAQGEGIPQPRGEGQRAQAATVEVSYTLKQVMRFKGFYLLVACFALSQFVNTGINFNLIAYLTDQGILATRAAMVVSLWALMGIPATLLVGYAAERLPIRYLLVLVMLGVAVGNVILTLTDSVAMGILFAVVQGSFFAAVLLYQTLVFADYYGRGSQGAIRGFITPVLMVANALGPLAATLVFDMTGSYLPIMYAYVGISVVAAAAVFLAAPPERG